MSPLPTAEVAVPVPLRRTFHYTVPADLDARARPGVRVQVQFGPQRLVGYVLSRETPPPEGIKLAPIQRVLDEELPTFEPGLLGLLRWISDYYRTPVGEVLKAAHPAGANERSVRGLKLTEAGRAAANDETGVAAVVLRALATAPGEGPVALEALEPVPADGLVRRLIASGWVERVAMAAPPSVRVRTERTVQAVAPAPEKPRVKRDEILAWLVGRGVVPVREVSAVFPKSSAALRQLIDEGRVAESMVEVLRDPFFGEAVTRDRPPALNAAQRAAVEAIAGAEGYAGFLLHGVTGSGKTEVYLHAIERVLARGRSALVLVPEIALTPQLVRRFRARLGDAIAVLHSGLSDGARFDQWRRVRRGELKVVIGARSALFAPLVGLGLIVVDEEHDPSFKQAEGVRYHARDMALVRGHREGAAVVLGSATPALETTHNASVGKLRRLVLAERPTGGRLPEVQLVDLTRDRPPKDEAPALSIPLRNALAETLGRGEQSILFLNRRGFSSFVMCKGCGFVFECEQCAVSMVWHRGPQLLRCHYCDAVRGLPAACPTCGAPELGLLGQGTERIEDGLRHLFPQARVARLDRDTATGRGLQDVLTAMRDGAIDILVGTQMVAKGHDFPNVTLVGVVAADAGLSFPDFRAAERTFQLLTQVAGRAGRGTRPGRVLIQTYNPEHPCLVTARRQDHAAFATADLQLRRDTGFPPYAHAVAIRVDGRDPAGVESLAKRVGTLLAPAPGVHLRGPAPAPLLRLRGRTRWALLLTAPTRPPLHAALDTLEAADLRPEGDARLLIDVDPQDFL